MITYIYANNYKTFVNFRTDFANNNLLLGGNGNGKSNLLYLVLKLCSFSRDFRNETNTVFQHDTCTRWMNSSIQTFELGLENAGTEYVYRLEIEHDPENDQILVLSEKLQSGEQVLVDVKEGTASFYNDVSKQYDKMISGRTTSVIPYIFADKKYLSVKGYKDCINKIIFCEPDPHQMTDIVENNVYIPTLNMSNTASLYTGLVETIPDFQHDFTEAMKEINASYIGANSSINSFPKSLIVNYKFKDVKVSFKLNELSDGEKVLFALYMVLYGYLRQGYTVLLDEPDNYLGLREIQPWCIELENILLESGQCILVSHHPEVINYFTDSCGIWLSRLESGESVVGENPFTVSEDGKILPYSELIARGMDVK